MRDSLAERNQLNEARSTVPIQPSNPLIVQSDRTLLLEVDHPLYAEARDALAQFAELEKSPEHIHTYRLTPLSLWNAAAGGCDATRVIEMLMRYSKWDLPANVVSDVRDYIGRYGKIKLSRSNGDLLLTSEDAVLIAEVQRQKRVQPFILAQRDEHTLVVDGARRGHIKQALVAIGYPAEDLAGYVEGDPLALEVRERTSEDDPFALREYQREAVSAFYAAGSVRG